MRKTITLALCLITYLISSGQESALSTDIFGSYKTGIDLYQKSLFGPAKAEMQKFLQQDLYLLSEKHNEYVLNAKKIILQSSLKLNEPGSDIQLINFVTAYSPDPVIQEPTLILGSYYYNERQYERALEFYDKVNMTLLGGADLAEASFKKAYSHFVLKDFNQAKRYFAKSITPTNPYSDPSNYYLGMCSYFTGDYDGAVERFNNVGRSSIYTSYIPYYVSQIYFSQGKNEQLIRYGENSLDIPNLRNRKEIRSILGQVYFNEEDFEKALPHLEYYEANTKKLTPEEFYQIAFTQYQLGLHDKAAENFRELTLLDSKLGQLANYYLADCYMNLQDYTSARSAFKKVSEMSYLPEMTEEALFNFGKLSAQLNFDREGINALVKIKESSPYFEESRKIINDMLLSSGDYENSLAILESLDILSANLQGTYQLIAYNRGIQLFNEGKTQEVKRMFAKADQYPIDNAVHLNIRFWEAYLLSKEMKIGESIIAFDKYLNESNGKGPFPDQSAPYMAHYIQGYNHLKTNDFEKAEIHFKNALVGININGDVIRDAYITGRIHQDATIRAADCLFKQNKYEEALKFYDHSSESNQAGSDYALYQKGLIEGLSGKPYDKILSLEDLVTKYPDSEYSDNAYYQLGDTYLELNNSGRAMTAFNTIVINYKSRSTLINPALLKLGLISYNLGDSDTALRYYKEVFDNNPSSDESHQALIAIEEIYIDDQGKSEEYFKFVNSIPGHELSDFTRDSLTFQIAQAQYEDAAYEKAIISYNKYLKNFDSGYFNLKARYYRGECYSILKLYKEAIIDYEYLVSIGYNDFYLKALRKSAIIAYNFNQEFDKAYDYYSLLASESRDEDVTYEALMGALRSAFRTSNNQGVLKFAPMIIDSPLATWEDVSSAYYYMAKASIATNQIDQAIIAFSEINTNRNNQAAEANFLLAEIYFQRNDYDLAEQQINFAVQNSNNYPYWMARCLLLYGDIHLHRGDVLNARAVTEAVIENYTGDEEVRKLAQEKIKLIEQKEAELNRIKTIDTKQLEMDTIPNG